MTRRTAQPYACPALERLTRQLLFAPPERRLDQTRRAERLHDQIEPDIEYPYEFIAYRITGHRSLEEADTLLLGRLILPDLCLLIDNLSRSIAWRPDGSELVESADELARRVNVSTKTITRWRRSGLRWRWMALGQPVRYRLFFPRAGVDRYLAINAQRVDRAVRFTRMTAQQRMQLLGRARRIADAAEVSLNQVATHLARRTGRAVETIRLLLEKHDQKHPDQAIFADRSTPLTVRQKRVIARAHRMGVSVATMVRHFRRTRATIYRAIRERRTAVLRQQQIDFIVSPTFSRSDADEVLLPPEPANGDSDDNATVAQAEPGAAEVADELPEPLRPLFQQPGIDAARQTSLLIRYNYLKYKADQVRRQLDRFEPRAGQLDQIEDYLHQANAVADRVLLANMPVLLSVAHRHLIAQTDRTLGHLLELLEQGQEVLVHSIEVFDAAHGQTFEAYLTWSLMRRFATRQPDQRTRAHRRAASMAILPRLREALFSSPPA